VAWLVLYWGNQDERWFQALPTEEQARIRSVRKVAEDLPPKTFLVHVDGRVFMVVKKSGMYINVKESPLGRTDTISTSHETLAKLKIVKSGDLEYESLVIKFWNK
jgi:hypothetical protein